MTTKDLYKEIQSLPPFYQKEIEDFVEFLKSKLPKQNISETQGKRKAGIGKGKAWIAPDFDAPLEDMKDYM